MPFLYTPFHTLQDGAAPKVNLLTKGNKRGKMRQIIFKKSYIVYTLLILFSSIIIPITNASSLSYQTDVGVSFTFNPTLSVSISSDLAISNLTPGTTDTSNEISVNVSTNNVYGYNLYATVGNSAYDNTSLTRSNSNDAFTSISTTANLPSLTTDNTWGYTYSLDNGTTWSNYDGLPLYTTDSPTRLKNNTSPSNDTINFKIAAKAGSTQPSGTYTNIINFTAITKPTPITLADAYAKEGKELYHGYYKMQDMTPTICEETEDIGSQLQVIDIRDDKVYWIAKLADNNCWMTQNLDLDLTSDPNADSYIALTSENTDLTDTTSPAYQDGYTVSETGVITWVPERDTIAYNNLNSTTWTDSTTDPYSYDFLDSDGNPVYPDNLVTKETAGGHGLSGNYYNWSAAIAGNNSGSISSNYAYGNNSICSKGWQLPTVTSENNTSNNLLEDYEIIDDAQNPSYTIDGFSKIIASPLYFIRAGYVQGSKLWRGNNPRGYYWSSATGGGSGSYNLMFEKDNIQRQRYAYRNLGVSVRCLAR